jgi:DNA-binding PadR family transcriptional regulator
MAIRSIRVTLQVILVVKEFLIDPDAELFGREIMGRIAMLPGTLYPILTRLVAAEWLTVRTEEGDPAELNRPVRQYYRLTDDGATAARAILARSRIQVSVTSQDQSS